MAKALKIAAIVVGVAAIVLSGGTAIFGAAAVAGFLGVSTATLAAITIGLSVAGAVLSLAAGALAKPPKLGSTIAGQQLQWTADPASGEPYVMGDAMVGASVVHQASWGDKNKFLGIVGVLSICTITAYDGFYADLTNISFSGRNASGYYANYLYLSTQLGQTPESSALDMTAPDATQMPDWGAAYKTSGLATAGMVLVADIDNGKIYSGGTPKFTNRIRGVKAYDARADSTVTGGSGTQRALDETTYAYSENPWVHAETYALGRWQNSKIVIGPGLDASKIDFASYMEAANIADANGWKISGQIMSTDSKWDALKAMAQAGGGYPMPTVARLSCLVNTPKVSLDTITQADVKGAVSAPQMFTRRSRLNGAIPRCRVADQGWEITPLTAVRNSAYLAADGGKEATKEIEFALVADKGDGAGMRQAAQLAAYEVANSRERGPISVELGYQWSQYKLGDCLTLDLPDANLNSQKCIVIGRTINVGRNTITLMFRTEDDAKHTWALGLGGSVSGAPTVVQAPGAGDTVNFTPLRTSYTRNLEVTAVDAGTDATIHLFGYTGGPGTAFQIEYDTPTQQEATIPATDLLHQSYATQYFLYADVAYPGDPAPTFGATTVYGDAINSAAHPNRIYLNQTVTTPASGGTSTGGASGGGGYGGGDTTGSNPCVTDDTLILMANEARDGPGEAKAFAACAVDDWVWTVPEGGGEPGAYRIARLRFVTQPIFDDGGEYPRASENHRFERGDGKGWLYIESVGQPAGEAVVGQVDIAGAQTYYSARPSPDPKWVLSHNLKPT